MSDAGRPTVLVTKLLAPWMRRESISRDRVMRLLAQGSERPLTVVCAPAGYGKTTALVTWMVESERPFAWVSLDAHDDDPQRLCAHLLAALDQLWPAAMIEAERALLGGSDLVETVVPLTSAALAEHADDGLVVVFDDFHTVTESTSHRVVRAFIDAMPPSVHVVVSSRTAPPLRLGRRRVAETVTEIGPEQLAFQGAESELLLNGSLGLGLHPEQIATINERVDGWAAGLALVAASLPSAGAREGRDAFLHAFARSRGAVAEYLIEEVLEGLPTRVQAFLCRTSILDRLSPSLCEAVLDDSDAAELLAEVRRSNLFVTALDSEWLRYHHLFADLLARQLRRDSPELIPELHRRAAAWFAANALPEDAIRHASAAGDGDHAATLLYDHWRTLLDTRRYATVHQLIEQLPSDRGQLGPFCDAIDARCMGLDGVDLRVVAQRLDALEAHRDAPGVAEMLEFTRVSPYYGDIGRTVREGWATWERYPDIELRADLAGGLGVVLWYAGDHDGVHRVVEPYLNVMERPRTRSWALAALALTAAHEGDVDLAERYAREAVEIAVANGGESALECHLAYVALGETLRHRGELDQAAEQLAAAAHLTSKLPGSLFQAFTLTFEAQLALTAGDRRRARARASAAHSIIDDYPDTGVLADRLSTIETALKSRSTDGVPGSKPTRSELRVLALLPTELTNPQIAAQLYLSNETVRSHIRRLYRRLGANTREQAVQIARERGLL
ncbi:MAG: ATP-dependent transcriptional regulator, MalT-like, LuxR family [Conexibacter sp.]|nr:ATP-dependent transcriptional regulator, MalT-like, LuxR family [Conexibacter sp.]